MVQPNTTLRVLGIDPGLNTTGYGVVERGERGTRLVEAGVIRVRAKGGLADRVAVIHAALQEILEALAPKALALEELYSHYDRPRTAILMGHARGVICLAAAQCQVPVFHYAATHVKKMLTGHGRATKGQMQLSIQRELSLSAIPEPADVADALALALCHGFALDRANFPTNLHFARRPTRKPLLPDKLP